MTKSIQGAPILNIVPDLDKQVIELRVEPNDIDVIYTGMRARFRLAAYSARMVPMNEGTVVNVLPDKISNLKSRTTYYIGRTGLPVGPVTQIT